MDGQKERKRAQVRLKGKPRSYSNKCEINCAFSVLSKYLNNSERNDNSTKNFLQSGSRYILY
jgi:hypothetical protein